MAKNSGELVSHSFSVDIVGKSITQFSSEKVLYNGLPGGEKCYDMFSHSDTIPEVTDGQTDRHTDGCCSM